MTTDRKVIVKGLPASPGNVAGRVHVILDPSHIDEFKEGEILVTEMTARLGTGYEESESNRNR